MVKTTFLALLLCFSLSIEAQTNRKLTNDVMKEVLKGNYSPSDYDATIVLDDPDEIVPIIQEAINADSLYAYLLKLNSFENRNSGSDTTSDFTGIGAARNWIKYKFDQFSTQNENRLLTGFFQFNQNICGMMQHRNVVAALPGTVNNGEIILVEAHMDSRCETGCDIDCEARGMEDNGSGTALVIELARVMSQFTFDKTILFATVTAEEQGLFGAEAMAIYLDSDLNEVEIKAVFNNDVVGGIICGETSSEPSCPGENLIDSTQVRLFSRGGFNSPHKGLARYIKLQYQQELLPYVVVPMQLTLMSAEDRSGRGGDHIPFGARGITSMRFTSAHEHGDAGIDDEYHDRQHTSEDVLGLDTNSDGVIDSFFVDFNYLARNTRINAVAAAMVAISPSPVQFEAEWIGNKIDVSIVDDNDYNKYVIGVRTDGNDYDSLYYFTGKTFQFEPETAEDIVRLSAASVDEQLVESCFSDELLVMKSVGVINEYGKKKYPAELWQNAPNPFDEATRISAYVTAKIIYKKAEIAINAMDGQVIKRIPIMLEEGVNEILYHHGYGVQGVYGYSLVVDGEIVDTKRMIFAN